MPGSLALLSAHFPTERRGRAIGQWASYTTLAIALGPVLGGVLVDVASWRWVFFINLPIAVFLLAVLYAGVPESRDESAARKLDIAGAVLITLGLGGLVFGLLESSRLGFASGLVWAPMVAGLVIIIMLILRQWLAASPMLPLPLSLFRSRAFSGANVITFLLYGAMSGSLFFLPFNLMQVQGWSATEAGAALLPLILAIAIFSFGAGAWWRASASACRWWSAVASRLSVLRCSPCRAPRAPIGRAFFPASRWSASASESPSRRSPSSSWRRCRRTAPASPRASATAPRAAPC